MRRLITATLLAAGSVAVVGATPALALTVSNAPNRDQALHLKGGKAPGGGNVDLRDTLASGGRPLTGENFQGSGTYRQTQTFSFGNLTTTVTTGSDLQPYLFDQSRRRMLPGSDLVGRRR